MEIPYHDQPCDLGLAPHGIRAEFGPPAVLLNYICFKAFLSTHFTKSFLVLPWISRFSSSQFLRSALNSTQGPIGLWPGLILKDIPKILLILPRRNTSPPATVPRSLGSYWEESPEKINCECYFSSRVLDAALSESFLHLPRVWVGCVSLNCSCLPWSHVIWISLSRFTITRDGRFTG